MSNGAANVNAVFGSSGTLSYEWTREGDTGPGSFFETTPSITNLSPGNYIVKVTDALGAEGFCNYLVVNDPTVPCCVPSVTCPSLPPYAACSTLTISDVHDDIESAIFNSVNGGMYVSCGGFVSFDISGGSIDLCGGDIGDVQVIMLENGIRIDTCVITDLSVLSPVPISPDMPTASIVDACDFSNQAALNTSFSEWLVLQRSRIELSVLGQGCNLTVSGGVGMAPIKCDGGSTLVSWMIDGDCSSTITLNGTFTVNAPTTLEPFSPLDSVVQACEYVDQAELNGAFQAWVNNQKSLIESSVATDGCNPIITGGLGAASAICVGGTTTLTWTVDDQCYGPKELSADFTVEVKEETSPVQPMDTTIYSCDYASQTEINLAYNNWLSDRYSAIESSIEGQGCSPEIFQSVAVPPLQCVGGNIDVVWTVVERCTGPLFRTATFTVSPPSVFSPEEPVDTMVMACDFNNQAALDSEFADWVSRQQEKIELSMLLEGCDPQITGGLGIAPSLCSGGTTDVTWTVSNQCAGPADMTASFTVEAPIPVTVTVPQNETVNSCTYSSQAQLNSAFTSWLDLQLANIESSITGEGCSPMITGGVGTAPLLCAGGFTQVSWTVHDLCFGPTSFQATYTVLPPSNITVESPRDTIIDACDLSSQTNANNVFAAWLIKERTRIENSIATEGCNPSVTEETGISAPSFSGGRIVVTWEVTDLCFGPKEYQGEFTITDPSDVSPEAPGDSLVFSCDFINQAQLNLDFQGWLLDQQNRIEHSVLGEGCTPEVIGGVGSSPQLCDGGAEVVTWNVRDNFFGPVVLSAMYTVIKPGLVTPIDPTNTSSSACDYASQSEVNDAFDNWRNMQLIRINQSVEGEGCNPQVSGGIGSAPNILSGGSALVTWTVSDLCYGSTDHEATFTITTPDQISPESPKDSLVLSCDFNNQSELEIDFQGWLAAQHDLVITSVQGEGCSPQVSGGMGSTPLLCVGGDETVTWTIQDNFFGPISLTATYTVREPSLVTPENPDNMLLHACDLGTQKALDEAFEDWRGLQLLRITQSIDLEGCTPQITGGVGLPPSILLGGSTMLTWTVTDLCLFPIQLQGTFTITIPDEVTPAPPADSLVYSCDFLNQDQLTADFEGWLQEQQNLIENSLIGEGCDPQITGGIGSSPLLCDGGVEMVSWSIVDSFYGPRSFMASYTVIPPSLVDPAEPDDVRLESCDFANQAAVDLVFDEWIMNQQSRIVESVRNKGCSPRVTGGVGNPPNIIDGGSTTVIWTVEDLCIGLINLSAIFSLESAEDLIPVSPMDTTVMACDLTDQSALDDLFNDWFDRQHDIIANSISIGGCDPMIQVSRPDPPLRCAGGQVDVVWEVSDLFFGTMDYSARFSLNSIEQVTCQAPASVALLSCDDSVDFEMWKQSFGASGDCDILLSYDVVIGSDTIKNLSTLEMIDGPDICGGSVEIILTAQGKCNVQQCSSTYTIDVTPIVQVFCPEDIIINEMLTQDSIDRLYESWLAEFGFVGGTCGDLIESDLSSSFAPLFTGGSSEVFYTVNDGCSIDRDTAIFRILVDPLDLDLFGPQSICAGDDGFVYTIDPILDQYDITWTYSGEGAIMFFDNPTQVELGFNSDATEGTIVVTLQEGTVVLKDSMSVSFAAALVCEEFCRGILDISSFKLLDPTESNIQEYWAELLLTSDGVVREELDISFYSGREVLLREGFEVELGGQLKVSIDFCKGLGLHDGEQKERQKENTSKN